jgi:hypothetical protein
LMMLLFRVRNALVKRFHTDYFDIGISDMAVTGHGEQHYREHLIPCRPGAAVQARFDFRLYDPPPRLRLGCFGQFDSDIGGRVFIELDQAYDEFGDPFAADHVSKKARVR